MSTDGQPRRKRNWLSLTLATGLGIVATVAVGWYQLSQVALAEKERARGVRLSIVSIVEEHVLNEEAIELPRLARLIDQRRNAEGVVTPITLAETIEEAEFNILKSAYLPFERKRSLKAVFDTLYLKLTERDFVPFTSETPHADLINELAALIRDGNSEDALQALVRLQESYSAEIDDTARLRDRPSFDLVRALLKNPLPIAVFVVIYAFAMGFVLWNRSFRRLLRAVLFRRWDDASTRETLRVPESIECPSCGSANAVSLGRAAGETAHTRCHKCDTRFFVHRVRDGIKISEETSPGKTAGFNCPNCNKPIELTVRSDRSVAFVHNCRHCDTHILFEGTSQEFEVDDLGVNNSSYECPHCGEVSKVWVSPRGAPQFVHECEHCKRLVRIDGPKVSFKVTPVAT